jgi:hypothetical protein
MFDTEGSWGKGNVTDPDSRVAWLARWYQLQAGFVGSEATNVGVKVFPRAGTGLL